MLGTIRFLHFTKVFKRKNSWCCYFQEKKQTLSHLSAIIFNDFFKNFPFFSSSTVCITNSNAVSIFLIFIFNKLNEGYQIERSIRRVFYGTF